MKSKLFFTVILCCLICGCNQRKYTTEEDDNSQKILLDMPAINDVDWKQEDMLSILDDFKYVVLELTDESIIGGIDKLEVYKDRIYILDKMTSSLFVFTIDGEFIYKINRVGGGPEEYVQLDFFSIDYENEHLVLTDLMDYWVMRFDMDGNFISRKKIPFWVGGVASLPNKGVALYANYRDNSKKFEQEYNLFLMDSTMHISKAYFPYNSGIYKKYGIMFADPGQFYYFNNICHFYSDHYNCIYEIRDNELEAKYTFDFGRYTFDVQKILNEGTVEDYLTKGDYYQLYTVYENDANVAFSFSNSGALMTGYYSKESGNVVYSPLGYTAGDYGFMDVPIGTYDSWIITKIEVDYLLSWKESVDQKKTKPDTKAFHEKNRVAEKITLDDNPVLVFYKLKPF